MEVAWVRLERAGCATGTVRRGREGAGVVDVVSVREVRLAGMCYVGSVMCSGMAKGWFQAAEVQGGMWGVLQICIKGGAAG